MLPIEQLSIPGDHPFFFNTSIGEMEAVMTIPDEKRLPWVAVLGHPHSLQGGTMNNKVVTTLARAFKELGIPSVRFNFRGVGKSQGVYDAGMGESEDMVALIDLWQAHCPKDKLLLAGFSFGSYVAYRASLKRAHDLLLLVAPPVHHYDYSEAPTSESPWVIIHGEQDEVVPYQKAIDFVATSSKKIPVITFPETGHFFHGQLLVLKAKIMDAVRSLVLSK